jgi:hypothetical protein
LASPLARASAVSWSCGAAASVAVRVSRSASAKQPPRGRELAVLLVAIGEVEERGHRAIAAPRLLERIARLGELAGGHQIVAVLDECIGRGIGRGLGEGRRGQDDNGDGDERANHLGSVVFWVSRVSRAATARRHRPSRRWPRRGRHPC